MRDISISREVWLEMRAKGKRREVNHYQRWKHTIATLPQSRSIIATLPECLVNHYQKYCQKNPQLKRREVRIKIIVKKCLLHVNSPVSDYYHCWHLCLKSNAQSQPGWHNIQLTEIKPGWHNNIQFTEIWKTPNRNQKSVHHKNPSSPETLLSFFFWTFAYRGIFWGLWCPVMGSAKVHIGSGWKHKSFCSGMYVACISRMHSITLCQTLPRLLSSLCFARCRHWHHHVHCHSAFLYSAVDCTWHSVSYGLQLFWVHTVFF